MNRENAKAWSLILQIGISMIVPIILCLLIGIWLDKFFGTAPVIMIVMIILGVGAGFRSVYVLTKEFYKDKDSYVDINKYRNKDKK
ncbi:MAG: AtpZ/AtpI family protein [Lachnospirales bacterium]